MVHSNGFTAIRHITHESPDARNEADITVRRADAAEHQHQRANDAEMLSSHRADNTDGHQTGIKNTSTPREAHG